MTAGACALGGVALNGEHIEQMWLGTRLSADAPAQVIELIDYDFTVNQKHGIYRVIPGLRPDDPIRVRSDTAPDQIDQRTKTYDGTRIRVGDPNRTISGLHRYRIDYALEDVAPGGELHWDAVGTAWEVEIEAVEVHVVAPWRFEDLRCHVGRARSVGGCELTQPEDGHLVVEVEGIDPGEGLTIQATRGAPIDAAPTLPVPKGEPEGDGGGLARPAGLAAGAGLLAAGATSTLVRRAGRERVSLGGAASAAWADLPGEQRLDMEELAALATTEVAPPEDLAPWMGGIILKESVQNEHKVAWLIEAAIAGAVEIVDKGRGRLVRGQRGTPYDAALDRMFGGRSQIDLGTYDEEFAAGWTMVSAELLTWRTQSGVWDPAGTRRMIIVRVLGVLAAVVGAVGTFVCGGLVARHGTDNLVPLALAGALLTGGLAAVVRGWELRVRTTMGSGLWLRVESFRRFLERSEAHHAEEAAKRGYLREYTAWAVAVGEIDRWNHAVQEARLQPSVDTSFVHVAPILTSSTSSTATAPSSSGGGGGGGGVGGGGGGGGGGSW